jgi:putative NADH-flavin reductase
MKLSIFGGSGRSGLPLIQQALERGHEIKALARSPEKLKEYQTNIEIIEGDASDSQSVDKTIEGTDAVINVLGHAKNSPKNILATSTAHIISGMNQHRLERIVLLTGAGVRVDGDEPKLFDRFIAFLLKILQGPLLRDSKKSVYLLHNSDLVWTVVRAPLLTEKPGNQKYSVGMVGKNTGPKLSRENAAAFMLDIVEKDQYIRQSPMISD